MGNIIVDCFFDSRCRN